MRRLYRRIGCNLELIRTLRRRHDQLAVSYNLELYKLANITAGALERLRMLTVELALDLQAAKHK